MRRNLGTIALAALAALGITTSGCSDQAVLDSGYYNFAVTPSVVQGGAFDCVLIDITNLRFRRADGTCSSGSTNAGALCGDNDDCQGGGICEGAAAAAVYMDGIQVLPSPLPLRDPAKPDLINIFQAENVGFTGQRCQSTQADNGGPLVDQGQFRIPPLVLSSGNYFLDRLRLVDIRLVDDTAGTISSCGGAINVVGQLATPVIVKVGKTQPNALRLTIDTSVLAPLLSGGSCGSLAPVITTFLQFN